MSTHANTGIVSEIKKVPPHYLFGVMLFASLWLMAQYFVTQKEYDKDQSNINSTLSEMRSDIKEILKRNIK